MDIFRTVRLSNPKHERNHLRHIVVKSKQLKGRGDICLYVPPNTDRTDLPVVLLLHGVYGSSFSWSQAAGAHHTAHEAITKNQLKPMILAMPSDGLRGDGSGYVPHIGANFEKWIIEDVLDVIQLYIPEAKDSKDVFISGLSMGGFGALRLGAKYAHKFKAISAHSAITAIDQMKQFIEEPLTDFQLDLKSDHQVLDMLRLNADRLPPFRFDCGQKDILIDHNRALHEALVMDGIPHTFEEFDGAHEWSYWEEHLIDSLLFFNSQL